MNNKIQSKSVAAIVACFTKRVAMTAIIAVTISFAANAQNGKHQPGDMSFGGHVIHFMDDGFSLTGIGAKFRYTVLEQLRVEAGFSYFFPNEQRILGIAVNQNMLDFSVNAHWLFAMNERFTLYPLAGLGLVNLRTTVTADAIGLDGNTSESHLIMNFGGGAELQLSDNISVHIEPRLLRIFEDTNRGAFTISAGVMFNF